MAEGQGKSPLSYWDQIIKLARARQKQEQDHANNYKTGREWDSLVAKHNFELAQLEAMKLFNEQGGYSPQVTSLSSSRTLATPNYQGNNEGYE